MSDSSPSRAPARPSVDTRLSPQDRVNLYAVRSRLSGTVRRACGLQIRFVTYFQDPAFAKEHPEMAFDEELWVDWEPGIADGPTSARFAVVDYDADTRRVATPAVWEPQADQFLAVGQPEDLDPIATPQFRQVSVWALLQRALAFFEEGNGLGRRIPWAFEGNRLVVVPAAGYGENAFYDRASKSLQFYYFGPKSDRVYTCLSADIVHHEFGHAVLDGIRPFYSETTSVQTAAFHEFMGDVTAILLSLRNNSFRQFLADRSSGQLDRAGALSSIAEEFGRAVLGQRELRNARNTLHLRDLAGETSPHRLSELLTGAMFDVLRELTRSYQSEPGPDPAAAAAAAGKEARGRSKRSPRQAFWLAADRMQRMALQPLDLLPPVEVTFRDYAIAVCRAEQLANPLDPKGYYGMLLRVFRKRGILSDADVAELTTPQYLYDRLRLSIPHAVGDVARSRAAAYRFLDDNRQQLLIPANRDFVVSDLYEARKLNRERIPMPRQFIIEYVWREDVVLDGDRFGAYQGDTTHMLCGGTLVFDESGAVLSWSCKPGSQAYQGNRHHSGATTAAWRSAVAEGTLRRKAMLNELAAQISAGRVSSHTHDSPLTGGLVEWRMPPIIAARNYDSVSFHLAPHLNLSADPDPLGFVGRRTWEWSY